nr:YadA-like family protein [Burkholderia stagnalis]
MSTLTTTTNNLGNSTASALGGGSTYDPVTGTVSAPSYTTYNANGTTSTANNVGAAIDSINSQGIKYFHANSTAADSQALGANSVAIGPNAVAKNAGDVALGSGSVTAAANPTATGTIGGATFNYAGGNPTSVVSVGAVGAERQVTNVAAGQVTATSTDAINGSQLFATNTAINSLSTSVSSSSGATNNVGSSTAAALGGGSTYDPATGTVSAPSYTTYNANGTTSTANNVGAAIDSINSQGIKYFHANSTAADSQALGANSVAIGPNAVAKNAGDVALGSGSVTAAANPTATGTIGGATFNYAGGNPTSVVSVGAVGAERQVTNVAAGQVTATSTDAINGSQLYATNTALDSLSTTVSSSSGSISSLSTSLSTVTTTVNNVGSSTAAALGGGSTYDPATGTVSAPSYTTYNANGTTSTANNVGSVIDSINSQGIKYFHANSTAADSQALGANSVAIGPNAVAKNAGDVALGSGSVTAAANPTATGTIGGVTYNYAGTSPTSVVSVGAVGAERQVTNVAAGQVTATSTDAINGSQLYATNTALDSLSTTVSSSSGSISSLSTSLSTVTTTVNNVGSSTAAALGGGSTYDPATGTVSAPSYTTYNANGTTSTANNVGSVIDSINSQGIKYFHANSTAADSQALGANSVAIGPNAVAKNAGDVALGFGSVTAAANPAASATIGGTSYSFAGATPSSVVSVGAAGAERQITNVAAGRISATSTDAVNGSQLYATNTALDSLSTTVSSSSGSISSLSTSLSTVTTTVNNVGSSTAAALGGGSTYDPATGTVSAPSYTTYNANGTTTTANNVGSVIDNINSQGIRYFHANSTAADSQALGANSVAIGPNAIATNAGDVALGFGSMTAAPNPTSSMMIGGVTYALAGSTPTSVVSVGAPGAERQITNVAAGRVSATSTDAVNGSQLNATNMAVNSLSTSTANSIGSLSTGLSSTNNSVASLSTATSQGMSSLSTGLSSTNATVASLSTGVTNISNQLTSLSTTVNNNTTRLSGSQGVAADMNGTGTDSPKVTAGTNSAAIGSGSTDGGRSNVVSVGSDSQQRQITNVAAGTQGTDAVNLNQLNALSTSVSQSVQNQQTQINNLGSALQQTDTMARQGIAAATALTMLPQVEPGKTITVAVGAARFAGQSGMAFGASARLSENGILKLGIGISGSNRTYGAGYGYSW